LVRWAESDAKIQNYIQELESKIQFHEIERKNWEERFSLLNAQCENAERSKYDLLGEVQELQQAVKEFKKELQNDKQKTRELREVREIDSIHLPFFFFFSPFILKFSSLSSSLKPKKKHWIR
jgi:chromosome segregation ATPase